MLAGAALLVRPALGVRPARAAAPLFAEVRAILLPGVERRIDHLALDPSGGRLFVAALGNGTLEVLDVGAGKRLASLGGLVEPQGVAYLPALHRIVVATSGGSVVAFDDGSYQRTGTLANMDDADNVRPDPAAGQVYVGYGAGAAGALAVIDPSALKIVASIGLGGGHPESFRLEEGGPRIFVNVPDARAIAVVDRSQRAVIRRIPLRSAARNYPMSLDERGHRLFVGARQPPELLVFDATSGDAVAAVPCVGDTDDLFYDARRDRVYVIGGEGYVDVFDAAASGKYLRLARIPTRVGARTGLWSADLDRLFVAWPTRDGRAAEIEVLAPAAERPQTRPSGP
jgi:DNA-binding beta-propeller fold protein YncE